MSSLIFKKLLRSSFENVPKKTYQFQCDEMSAKYEIRLQGASQYHHCHRLAAKFDAFYAQSTSGNKIACLMIKSCDFPKYTILFSHGATVDLGNMANYLYALGQRLSANVFVYDYSGYGQSEGTPTQEAVYADAETVMRILQEKYSVPVEEIVLYGQSLGTAPTLHLASMNPTVRAAILHSPFLSAAKLNFDSKKKPLTSKCRSYDIYRNIELIDKCSDTMPILVMHGTDDLTVPITHAKELVARAQNPVKPLWVEGGGHDDLYTYAQFMQRLKQFFEVDIADK